MIFALAEPRLATLAEPRLATLAEPRLATLAEPRLATLAESRLATRKSTLVKDVHINKGQTFPTSWWIPELDRQTPACEEYGIPHRAQFGVHVFLVGGSASPLLVVGYEIV
ncbi:hypothetical protein E2P81_ATG08880 [Venturia nashicola]|nr:hypothetical protein E2P81_ATG08880 [Venturia nashicola]